MNPTRRSGFTNGTAGTPYDIRVIADGQQVDVFVDGGSKISYASASVNETETKHGIRESLATTSTFDNFAVYSRTSSAYAALDKS